MSWLWGSSVNTEYEELVEKACSPLKLAYPQGEDIALNLEVTDMIRSKAVQPKQAMQSLKRRIASPNGRVQMYALSLVDTCIKNGGDHFLAEIASKEFVDEMTNVVKAPGTNADVRQMALRMFQSWAIAFQSKRELVYFVDAYNDLKNSGVRFPPPPVHNSSHILETATAPAWVDSDVCMRCRTAFTFTNRKHHCRNCGLVFDQACSSRTMALPKFGIKEEVRVCEGCWLNAGKNKPAPAVPGRTPRTRRDYDADLQRAIELSLAQNQPGGLPSEPPLAVKAGALDDEDEQMRLAIEASLRDMERARPSAPAADDIKPLPTFDLNANETQTVLTFSNTMDQMAAYGERDLRRFPHAQLLHDQAMAVGGKLQRNAEEKSTKAAMLTEMQAKLSEAVALYGNILDGQQAYAQRKAQEAQHAPYQMYGYPQQQQGYYVPPQAQPYGHTNGYATANGYAPAPPQHAPPQHVQPQHAPQQAQRHAPSMYPAMPTSTPAYGYPQQYAAAQGYAPPAAHAWQPNPPSRQASYADSAAKYTSEGAYAAAAPDPYVPSAPPTAASVAPSAPPPVDLASHPSLSPRSVHASMPPASPNQQFSVPSAPPRSASYSSTIRSPVAAPAEPNPWESVPSAPSAPPLDWQQQSPHLSEASQHTQQHQQQQQAAQQAQHAAQSAQQQAQQQHEHTQRAQQQQQQQQQWQQSPTPAAPNHAAPAQAPPADAQLPQGWYTASMFPAAPAVAPFPNAPADVPSKQQAEAEPEQAQPQKQEEEALLIEL